MKKLLFTLPSAQHLSAEFLQQSEFEAGLFTLRQFPDGESYIRVLSEVEKRNCYVLASLKNPDTQFLPLYFLIKTLKKLGAKKVVLVAPYLSYMRQDIAFNQGECVAAVDFAQLVSQFVDELITIDPHLHRIKKLSEVYSIPARVLSSTQIIGTWIQQNLPKCFIVGPDSESDQWVMQIAQQINVPYVVLNKTRLDDRTVLVSQTDLTPYKNHVPIIVDDIISTAHTMIQTIHNIMGMGLKAPVCIGIHALFADEAFAELKEAGPTKIVTANTIKHSSNQINLTPLLLEVLLKM